MAAASDRFAASQEPSGLEEVLRWLADDDAFADYTIMSDELEGERVTRLTVRLPQSEPHGGACLRLTVFEDGSGRDCLIEILQ